MIASLASSAYHSPGNKHTVLKKLSQPLSCQCRRLIILQISWIQFKPDRKSGLIKIPTVRYSFFLFVLSILPDPLSSIIDRSTLYTLGCRMQASLTCTGGDFPCTEDIQLTIRSEGRCTYLVWSLQMTPEKACSDTEIFLAASGDRI